MASLLEIIVSVVTGNSKANLDKLNKSLQTTGTASQTSGQKLGDWAKKAAGMAGIALGAGAAVMALGKFLKDSVAEAAEAEKVQAQLNAVLESTQGAAGMSSEALDRLASSLSDMSGIEDDTILKAEAMMLTFTKIGKDVFPQAMDAALNLSRAYGIDLQSAI